jgi:hypothetical protein
MHSHTAMDALSLITSESYVVQSILENTCSQNQDYIGREDLVKSTHPMGPTEFKILCNNLWFGKFLFKLATEKPTNRANVKQLEMATSSGVGPRAMVTFMNEERKVFVRSFGRITEDECIALFYD